MANRKIAYTLGRGRASISVLSGPEILIWTNGPGAALRGWSRSGYLDQEGLKVDPGPDLQSGAIIVHHSLRGRAGSGTQKKQDGHTNSTIDRLCDTKPDQG